MPAEDRPERTWVPRALGAATLAYSLAAIAAPAVVAKPVRLLDDDGTVPVGTAAGIRALSGRDVATSLAMLTAPPGPALRLACLVRTLSDVTDAVVFGRAAPPGRTRAKVMSVTLGWGTVCLLGRRLAG